MVRTSISTAMHDETNRRYGACLCAVCACAVRASRARKEEGATDEGREAGQWRREPPRKNRRRRGGILLSYAAEEQAIVGMPGDYMYAASMRGWLLVARIRLSDRWTSMR